MHVVQTRRAPMIPGGGTNCASCKIRARVRPVRDLDALAFPREQDSVVADDIAAANGLKAYGFAFTRTGVTLASIDRIRQGHG